MSVLVVTAADENYAPLLRDLLSSLAIHKTTLNFRVAVLDLGLTPSTRSEIETQVDQVISPKWMFKSHPKFDADTKYLSRAARPFLPDLMPGHAIYVWLDADTWIQQRQGLEWLIDAARGVDIAAVPTLHRAYVFRAQDLSWLHERYAMAFGASLANELVQQPYFNAGVMAIRAGSGLWRVYAERFQSALDRWEGDFLSDQAILNAAIILDRLAVNRLPAKVNWLCHLALPLWNAKTKLLVEPALPFEPLLIVHNTFNEKQQEQMLSDGSGQPRRTQLTRTSIQLLVHSDSQ
jgi:lipopolysaccharide biosynthesis glycosyltransferase